MKKFAAFVAFVLLASGLGTTYATPVRPLVDQGCEVVMGPIPGEAKEGTQTFTVRAPVLQGIAIRMVSGGNAVIKKVKLLRGVDLLGEWNDVSAPTTGWYDLDLHETEIVNHGETLTIQLEKDGVNNPFYPRWSFCDENYQGGVGTCADLPGCDFMFKTYPVVANIPY